MASPLGQTGGGGSSMPPLGENINGGGGLSVDFRQQRLFTTTTAVAQDPGGTGPTIVRKNTQSLALFRFSGAREKKGGGGGGGGDFVRL
jgi:hypothetical protein